MPLAALFLALACSGGSSTEPAPAASVEVSADGTRFEPPVDAADIPDGAWICEMNGSVHYASTQQGDGSCPVCGMHLVHKGMHHE